MSLGAPQFHTLTIADVRRETPESVSLAFAIPAALSEAYRFAPGQHVTLKRVIGGEEVRRSYSICSGLDEGELRVAVKKQEGGVFSGFVQDGLKPGDALEVMTPSGHFTAPLDPKAARTYLGIAAGSGITPLLSIVKTVLAREPKSRFFLLYGNRTTQSIMFRAALEELKDRFLDRFSLTHVLSREAQDVPVLSGRIDAEKIALFLRGIGPVRAIDHAFVCGPAALIDTAERVLEAQGLLRQRLHLERFTVDGAPSPRRVTPGAATAARRVVAEAEAVLDGIRHRFPIAAGETVIDAALAAGLELPYSCRGGMCCTCRARLVSGAVEMDHNYSLEPWELQAGYVLTCQSRPTTATLVLDYDQV
ncbi:MAG: 1,2-phenylacetyl-CoA epoxidase subunit PaaE [Stellaceae bacterium]